MSKQTIEVDVPENKELVQFIDNHSGVLTICFKDKKETVVKDFNWYIEEYFKQSQIYDRELAAMYVVDLFQEQYDKVPFEMKIGLLKFICDDLKYDWINTLYPHKNPEETNDLMSILPNGFYKSILL